MMRKKLLFCNACQCLIAHVLSHRGIGCSPEYRCIHCGEVG